jgi:hypothetical protein
MQIQVNTDNTIQGREDVIRFVTGVVQSKLGAVSSHITRIEVHIGDENRGKHGPDDKRCMVEARLENRKPVAVHHAADTIQSAVTGAVDKMRNALDSDLGKMKAHR